ncbi:class A beta-lactamase [Mycolicibacterium insubricum]|nr:serine hydrolase [Mycolicibacterium insubricum]BBZ64672.1 class A beta-lactamase [Mycolicibacterium insubricum]
MQARASKRLTGRFGERRRSRSETGIARDSSRRFGAALTCAVLAVSTLDGCTSGSTPSAQARNSVHISIGTPQGVRAQQVVDMLNSDWPIGTDSVKTLAGPDQVDFVAGAMDLLWWERPYTVADIEYGASSAELTLNTSYGGQQLISLRVNDDSSFVDRFSVSTPAPPIHSWADVNSVLDRSGARYSWRVSKIVDGNCEQLAGAHTDLSLPLSSIFKTYVLYAVAEEVVAGRLAWDDEVTVTVDAKANGSSAFDHLKPGDRIPVRLAAEKMIANSDNMATDLLIEKVGRHAVERALADAGHHDPASMTPFPTMHELFSIGWGKPDLREQWRDGDKATRNRMLREADARRYVDDPMRAHTPASPYGVQWYGSAEDICRIQTALQRIAVGPATPVRDIMSTIPGIDLDRTQWPYIGAKAGNLPGDLTYSWYAVDRAGTPWVVSLQTSWDTFHGARTAAWLMGVVKGMFALIPQR